MYRPYHMYTSAAILENAAPAFIIAGSATTVEFLSPGGVTFEVTGPTGIIEIPIKEITTLASGSVTVLSQ